MTDSVFVAQQYSILNYNPNSLLLCKRQALKGNTIVTQYVAIPTRREDTLKKSHSVPQMFKVHI